MKPKPDYGHPLADNISKRWSPRAYSEKELTEVQIMTLFEAARWAASCMNAQPWRFIWSPRDHSQKYQMLLDCLNPSNREWAFRAPLLILSLVKTDFANGKPNPWARHDLGLAIGNFTLQASAMDIFVHNMGGFDASKARELFQLPDHLEPVTMITAGYLGDSTLLSEYNQKREQEIQTRMPLQEMFL